jgi:histidinol dehydrogenase
MNVSRIIEGRGALDAFIRDQEFGSVPDPALTETVRDILETLRKAENRRLCLADMGRRFDARDVAEFDPIVSAEELENASVEPRHHDAIRESIRRVTAFHAAQLGAITSGMRPLKSGFEWTTSIGRDGGYIGQRLLPVQSAGVYAPGGKATYPSSVIMNAVPAMVAGAERIVLATPARADGSLTPAVLVAARELGITRIIKAGGASAIGALAFGVGPSMPAVDVVAGPGNAYVNEAKRQLWGQVGLDLFAGSSEVAVYVDRSSDPRFAAADLLTQIEHAEDNVAVLVASDRTTLERVLAEVETQLKGAAREAIMRTGLKSHGIAIVAPTEDDAASVINAIAPEHLSLLGEDPEGMSDLIRNSGAILLGPYSAQSAGDFAAGPSHTLPTARAARFAGPVNVLTFMKLSSITRLQATDLMELLPTVKMFGEMEGFPAHARGSQIRFQE